MDRIEQGELVVTGGAGFIGTHVVTTLLRAGVARHVTVVDDLSSGSAENLRGLGDAVDLVVHDVRAMTERWPLLVGVDAVVHLAARVSVPMSMADPLGTNEVNATGTLEVLEAARRAGGVHTIVASSAAVYGQQDTGALHERLTPRPASPYAASKLVAEAHAAAYTRAYGLPTVSLRLFNVFGPGQAVDHAYAAAVPAFVSAALDGRPLVIHGDGEQTRDLVHVATVAEVVRRAVEQRLTATEPVNLASGSTASINEVVATLAAVVGHPLVVEHGPPRRGDLRHSQADTARLAELLPATPTIALAEGLRDTVAWFRQLESRAMVPPAPAGFVAGLTAGRSVR